MVVSDRHVMRPSFDAALEAALRGGARWFQLREKDLARHDLLELAQRAQNLCAEVGAILSVNGDLEIAKKVGARGIHWPEAHTEITEQSRFLTGKSAHAIHKVRGSMHLDYLVFGSIFPTASHPGSPGVGLSELRRATVSTPLPVFAIGGIDVSRVRDCIDAGAYGVGVLGAVWKAANIENAVAQLLREVH